MARRPVQVRVGKHAIGGPRCFVIAEAGVNHNGRLDLARRLVNAAARCGADAVKFQAFDPEQLVTAGAERAPYQREAGTSSQLEMLRRLTLPPRAWAQLAALAASRGLEFLVTPFDHASLETTVAAGVRAIKLGSGEVTNLPLLRAASRTGLPVLLSTGMSTSDEVDTASRTCRRAGCRQLVLFHCVSAYPAPPADMNVRVIPEMAARYRVPIGLSDHTQGIAAAAAAVALGATAIEKHLTLDTTMDGPDHASSLDPAGFTAMVDLVREVETSLGDGEKRCMPSERANVRHVRRSCVAAIEIPAGTTIRRQHLVMKRPETGIPAADVDTVIGRRTTRVIRADHPLQWRDLTR